MELRCGGSQKIEAGKENVVSLLVDIFPRGTPSHRGRLNISLCIDSSLSMAGNYLNKAKESVSNALNKLNDQDTISVISFDSVAAVRVASSELTARDSIRGQIKKISLGALTNMFDGLQLSFEELKKTSRKGGVINRLILLSDGEPTAGRTSEREILELCNNIRSENVTIDAIGLGGEYNLKLMEEIASEGGGVWIHVTDPNELGSLLGERIADMSGTQIVNPSIKISLLPGARVLEAFSVMPQLNKLKLENDSDVITIPVRDLVAGEQQELVFKIAVPMKTEGQYRIARIEIGDASAEYSAAFLAKKDLMTNSGPDGRAANRADIISEIAEATTMLINSVKSGRAGSVELENALTQLGARGSLLGKESERNEVKKMISELKTTIASMKSAPLTEVKRKEIANDITLFAGRNRRDKNVKEDASSK